MPAASQTRWWARMSRWPALSSPARRTAGSPRTHGAPSARRRPCRTRLPVSARLVVENKCLQDPVQEQAHKARSSETRGSASDKLCSSKSCCSANSHAALPKSHFSDLPECMKKRTVQSLCSLVSPDRTSTPLSATATLLQLQVRSVLRGRSAQGSQHSTSQRPLSARRALGRIVSQWREIAHRERSVLSEQGSPLEIDCKVAGVCLEVLRVPGRVLHLHVVCRAVRPETQQLKYLHNRGSCRARSASGAPDRPRTAECISCAHSHLTSVRLEACDYNVQAGCNHKHPGTAGCKPSDAGAKLIHRQKITVHPGVCAVQLSKAE